MASWNQKAAMDALSDKSGIAFDDGIQIEGLRDVIKVITMKNSMNLKIIH